MQFTNTIWLWGLTALAVPIAIHLLSRKEGKVIRLGSVRHLEETNTKQFKSLRLNEVLLLILRCLVICLLVALLAGLSVDTGTGDRAKWLVIESGLEHDKDFASLIDSLSKQGFVKKQLAPGFPSTDSAAASSQPDYWTLAERLGQQGIDQAVVLSYNRAAGFQGERDVLPINIKWISKDPAPAQFIADATRTAHDSLTVRLASTKPTETSFATTTVSYPASQRVYAAGNDTISIHLPDTVAITLVSDSDFAYDKNIIQAALQAIDESVPTHLVMHSATPDQYTPTNDDWLIWLTHKGGNEKFNGNKIVVGIDGSSNTTLLRQVVIPGRAKQWQLTQRLNESVALRDQLTLHLADILLDRRAIEHRADRYDQRAMPNQQLWSNETNMTNTTGKQRAGSNTAMLVTIALLLTLIAERIIALRRNQ